MANGIIEPVVVGAGFSPRGGWVATDRSDKRPQAKACAYKYGAGRVAPSEEETTAG